jgi:peptidoglycan/LPS O-acetylase OafA/YrhL
MFFCLAFGWFILLDQEYEQLGKHVAGNSVFSGNFILLNESGYFDTSAERKILLHLWSLGIEEQFYIFWPLVLWLSYKKGVDATQFILCAIAISLLVNCILSYTHPVGNFYLPIGRFWELLTGAFLALPQSKNLIIKLNIL